MQPTSPWQLIRHLWMQQFRRNPVAAVLGPVLLLGGIAILLFFSVFLTIGLMAVGAVALVYQSLFMRKRGGSVRGGGRYQYEQAQAQQMKRPDKTKNNKEIEGEYKVISRDDT